VSTNWRAASPAALQAPALNVAIVAAGVSARQISGLLKRAGARVVLSTPRVDDEAIASLEASSADIVVLAEDVPRDAAALLRSIAARLPHVQLVVVLRAIAPRAVRAAISAGADAVIAEERLEDLPVVIASTSLGYVVAPGRVRSALGQPTFTPREKQVLALLVLGLSNGEIARKLYLSETTVKSHLSAVFKKLGARSRTEAVDRILDPESGLGTGILEIPRSGALEQDDAVAVFDGAHG